MKTLLFSLLLICPALLLVTRCKVEREMVDNYSYHVRGKVEDTCGTQGELFIHLKDRIPGDDTYAPQEQVTKVGRPGAFDILYTSENAAVSRLELTCKFKLPESYRAEVFKEIFNLDYLDVRMAGDGNPVLDLGTITFDCD